MKQKIEITVNQLLTRIGPAQIINVIDTENEPEQVLYHGNVAKFKGNPDKEIGERKVKLVFAPPSEKAHLDIFIYSRAGA